MSSHHHLIIIIIMVMATVSLRFSSSSPLTRPLKNGVHHCPRVLLFPANHDQSVFLRILQAHAGVAASPTDETPR